MYESVVADLDGDGFPEIIAGAAVYSNQGEKLWQNSSVGDGFSAIGDFTGDGFAEIVVVSVGRVTLLDRQGGIVWGPVALTGAGRGGAPTVADVDGDGEPEIGVAGGSRYTVFDTDGSILWSAVTRDFSSSVTGSSVFDFDGDGQVEVVYNDEIMLRVYRGRDGAVLFETPNTSGTTYELPVIVDVDNDNHADIVVCSNSYAFRGETGIRVYQDVNNNWVDTRKIWNQHSYHIDNINDDGTIPQYAQPSWLSHNTYRLNTFLDRNPLDSADLSVALLRLADNGTGQPQSLTARIGNGGLLSITQAIAVTFYQGDPTAGGVLLGTVTLDGLERGGYTDIRLDDVTLTSQEPLYVLVDPDNQFSECDETNNRMSIPLSTVPLGTIAVSTDASSYGPQSPATLEAMVTNTGSFASDYTAVLEIVDSSDAIVIRFDAQPVTALNAGEFLDLSQAWNTGTTLAGDYILRGTLYAPDGNVLDEAEALFTIGTGGTPTANLRTTTDQAIYHTTDTVQIANLARNTTTNVLIPAAQIEIQVTDPNGQLLFSETLAVGDLAPGGQRELTTPMTLQASPEGDYTVTGTLRDGNGTLLATDQTLFTVQESVTLALSGTVTAMYPELERGEGQVCTDELNYTGTQPLTAQPIRQLVVRLDDETLIQSIDQTLDLNPGVTQTLSRTIETGSLSAGDYACVLQAEITSAWQTLDSAVFRVTQPPVKIDASLEPGERGRVLILLDDPAKHQGNDPLGSNHAPPLAEQRTYLETLLTEAGWSYTITTNDDDFTSELRTGGYLTYLLLSEHEKLAEAVQKELREAVYRGEGLIEAGSHDQRQGRIDEALGIKFKGKLNTASALWVNDPLLLTPGAYSLSLLDKPLRAELNGAQALGEYLDGQSANSGVPALTEYTYGQGRSVYMGFDLLAEATYTGGENDFGKLLLNALEHVYPADSDLQPGGVYPLAITLSNQGIATPGRVILTLPAGVTMVDPQSATLVDIPGGDPAQWQWLFNLAEDETLTLTAWVRLPEGGHDFTASVDSGTDPDWVEQTMVELTLTTAMDPDLLLTLSDVEARGNTYKHVAKYLGWAHDAVTVGDYAGALGDLVRAGERATNIGTPEADALRLTIAQLLRAVGQQLTLAP